MKFALNINEANKVRINLKKENLVLINIVIITIATIKVDETRFIPYAKPQPSCHILYYVVVGQGIKLIFLV